jgi:basic amino acid/polyamine antiporter, APA family
LSQTAAPRLARRLGTADVVLIVMGSIIGSGIFRTPSVVAQRVHAPFSILLAWAAGGLVALFGAFVLGELAARRSDGYGVYAYLRDAFHPVVAFAFGWTSLLVSFTGGIAASAVLFAAYFEPLTGMHVAPLVIAVVTIALLTAINCIGVRESGNVQNALTLLKAAALAGIVLAAAFVHPATHAAPSLQAAAGNPLIDFGVAMIPVLFAYNGAAVAGLMTLETKAPARTLPIGLWGGMLGVIVLYLLVNAACIYVLGADGLAKTATPASDVLFAATGSVGARIIAGVIAISTLGFISNRMLTAPRLYHAMADDGLFFRQIGRINPKTLVPVAAVVLQGTLAIVITLSGSYEQILNYVVSTAYVFAGLFALALLIVRAQDRRCGVTPAGGFRMPGHPISTIAVMIASWSVALDTYIKYPIDGLVGLATLLSAVPVYFIWKGRKKG